MLGKWSCYNIAKKISFFEKQSLFNKLVVMGIAKGALKLLLNLKKANESKFHGKVLQLGRQCVYVSYEQVKREAKAFGVAIDQSVPITLSFDKRLKERGFIDDITLFKMLGFDAVHSLDASDYEGASIVHDLNMPVNQHYYQQYDFIYDGGTLEHVFHFPNALSNIHKMLKVDGLIIHCSPSHNHVDHGFYMYSPMVFPYYYSINKYDIKQARYFKYSPQHDIKPWKVYEYTFNCLQAYCYGGFGKEMIGIWFAAEKTESSTEGNVPQQSFAPVNMPGLSSWFLSSGEQKRSIKARSPLMKMIIKMIPIGLKIQIKKILAKRNLKFVGYY